MVYRKSQYINLEDRPEYKIDNAEKKYRLFSPRVQLSGPQRGKAWKQPRGIFIEHGSEVARTPLINIFSIFKAVVFGVSFLVYAIGKFFKNPGSRGQLNGGQA